MCNPRKVMIHLARSIEGAWRRTVEQAATAQGQVNELGRLTADIRLDEEMGAVALEMLEQVLAQGFEGFEPWQRGDDGQYRREQGEVTLMFDPQTGRLLVETQLTEQVSAEARAQAEAAGFSIGEVAADAIGNYYEDGWGGRTKERAEQEAQAAAEQRLEALIEELQRRQNPDAFAQAETQAQAQAQELAQTELRKLQDELRAVLRQRLSGTLYQAESRIRYLMNRAVGEAYRLTLLRLVKDNGGRVLTDEKTGSVINMEMELY